MKSRKGAAVAAWLLAALYYFYQYMLRSSPAVMMPQLTAAFGLSTAGVASLVGLFYYGYAPVSLIAGPAMDRLGAKAVVPLGALMAGVGALLFGTGSLPAAQLGRFLQGAGGVFALIGAIYIVTKNFPVSSAATMVGATQMFGSSGGSAGQFLVGPMITGGVTVGAFWTAMGIAGIVVAIALFFLLPKPDAPKQSDNWLKGPLAALVTVFKNPQTLLCGLVAGLVFMPTTIFDMIWGVRFLQEGHGFDYGEAVIRSATVPLGWIIGSPLMGYLSDRLGRRKPVIIGGACLLLACLAWILFGPAGVLPPYVLGLLAGIASGGAMLLYTVVKEVNPPQFAGTSTGVIGFLNFTLTALMGPVFGSSMQRAAAGADAGLVQYQMTFKPLLYAVALAIVLTAFLLRETGPAATTSAAKAEAA
jgi:sugar phosphate permease